MESYLKHAYINIFNTMSNTVSTSINGFDHAKNATLKVLQLKESKIAILISFGLYENLCEVSSCLQIRAALRSILHHAYHEIFVIFDLISEQTKQASSVMFVFN